MLTWLWPMSCLKSQERHAYSQWSSNLTQPWPKFSTKCHSLPLCSSPPFLCPSWATWCSSRPKTSWWTRLQIQGSASTKKATSTSRPSPKCKSLKRASLMRMIISPPTSPMERVPTVETRRLPPTHVRLAWAASTAPPKKAAIPTARIACSAGLNTTESRSEWCVSTCETQARTLTSSLFTRLAPRLAVVVGSYKTTITSFRHRLVALLTCRTWRTPTLSARCFTMVWTILPSATIKICWIRPSICNQRSRWWPSWKIKARNRSIYRTALKSLRVMSSFYATYEQR